MKKGLVLNVALALLLTTSSVFAAVGVYSAFLGKWTIEAPFQRL